MQKNIYTIDWIPCYEGIEQKNNQPLMEVYQNTPNPFKVQTQVNVTLRTKGTLSLEVFSLLGQKVAEIDKGNVNPAITSSFFMDLSLLQAFIFIQ